MTRIEKAMRRSRLRSSKMAVRKEVKAVGTSMVVYCPLCGSRDNRYRVESKTFQCRRCPAVYRMRIGDDTPFLIEPKEVVQ